MVHSPFTMCVCMCICMCMYVCTHVAASDQPWVLLLMAAIIRVSLRQELTLLLGPAPHILEQAAPPEATWILLVPTSPMLDFQACATNVQLFMWSNSGPHVCRRERNWVMILWEPLKIEMGMRELLSPTVHLPSTCGGRLMVPKVIQRAVVFNPNGALDPWREEWLSRKPLVNFKGSIF